MGLIGFFNFEFPSLILHRNRLKQFILQPAHCHGNGRFGAFPLYFQQTKIAFDNHVAYAKLVSFRSARTNIGRLYEGKIIKRKDQTGLIRSIFPSKTLKASSNSSKCSNIILEAISPFFSFGTVPNCKVNAFVSQQH